MNLKFQNSSRSQWLTYLLLTAALMIATVFRGGNRHVPLLAIELLCILAFCGIAFGHFFEGERILNLKLFGLLISPWLIIAFLCFIAIFYLTEIPSSLMGVIGNQKPSFEDSVLRREPWSSISTAPMATMSGLLAGIPIAIFFIAPLYLSSEMIRGISFAWICSAVFQCIVAGFQIANFEWWYFDAYFSSGVLGTFGNRNHLANFLVMTIPLSLFQIRSCIKERKRELRTWIFGSVLFISLFTLLATASRSGIIIGAAALLSGWLTIMPKSNIWHLRAVAIFGLFSLVGTIVFVSGLDWLDRFEGFRLEASADTRILTIDRAWQASLDFWPLGAGLGSFASLFPQYQSSELGDKFIEYAHNDYLQMFFEVGIFSMLLFGLVFLTVMTRILFIWRNGADSFSPKSDRIFQISCGIGFASIAIHALVDFPMHIPVNAMLGGFLLGAFLSPVEERTLVVEVAKLAKRRR